jgi:hypothetical protein
VAGRYHDVQPGSAPVLFWVVSLIFRGVGALEKRAAWSVLGATGAALLVALLGGLVRLLPWLLDPAVSFRLALPFARGVLALAVETSLLVGWPIGWALASVQAVERGEARVLFTLGQSPSQALGRLAPQAVALAALLGAVAYFGGLEASEPGRVVTELIEQGERACETRDDDGTYAVPFAGVTWLCAPGVAPRLVGRGPGALGGAIFTARGARVSGDLRQIELAGARVLLGTLHLDLGALRLRGLAPFGHASNVSPWTRAAALVLAGALAAFVAARAVLVGALRGRIAAVVAAAAGSLAALGTLRSIELGQVGPLFAWAAPVAAFAAPLAAAALLSRLPGRRWTASK